MSERLQDKIKRSLQAAEGLYDFGRMYATIVGVADKIPNIILEEDPKLLMWYDQAVT